MKRTNISLVIGGLVAILVVAAVGLMLRPTQGAAQDQQPLLEYPDYPPTPTIGANPTSAPSLSSGETLASASFDDASALTSWEIVDLEFVLDDMRSNWIVVDGRLVQDYAGRARSTSIQQTAALTGDAAWADYSVRVSFYDEFNGVAGVIARYTGDDPTTASYYRYRILKDAYEATPKQVLEKVVNGVATSLVEVEGPGFTERAWHTLELTVVGGQISVLLDGKVVAEAQDASPLAAGRAGLYTRAIGGLLYDDFAVVAP